MANKKFIPTAEHRAMVAALYAYGAPQDEICGFIINPNTGKPISKDLLLKYFEPELTKAKWKVVREAADNLLQNARGRPAVYDENGKLLHAEKPSDTTAAIFICKALGKWSDRVAHEHSGQINQNIRTVYLTADDAKI